MLKAPAMLGTNFKGALEKAPKLHHRHSPEVGPTFKLVRHLSYFS